MRTPSNLRCLVAAVGILWAMAAVQALAGGVSPADLFKAAAQMKMAAKQARTLGKELESARPDDATIESALSRVRRLTGQIKGAKAVLIRHLRCLPYKTQIWFEGPFVHIDVILEQVPFMLAADRDLDNASGTLKTLAASLERLHKDVTYMAQRASENAR